MGELEASDEVFGSDGRPVKVLQAKPAPTDHGCYRVTFVGGTSIIASYGHLWMTKLASTSAAPRVRTTGEMRRDGEHGLHATRVEGSSEHSSVRVADASSF